jgi:hypothetical protein
MNLLTQILDVCFQLVNMLVLLFDCFFVLIELILQAVNIFNR